MPLILGEYALSKINGPSSICVLRSKVDTVGYDNTLILFGDYHANKVYDPISTCATCESNFNLDFIEKLNIFAKNHTTEFYLENWFKYHSSIEHPTTKQQIRDKRLFLLDPDNKELLQDIKRRSYKHEVFQRENSMIEFDKLYQGCFYKKLKDDETLCPYKNIIWQYTDVRQTPVTSRIQSQFENVLEKGKIDFCFFVNVLYIKKHEIYKLRDNKDEDISNKSEKLKLIDNYIDNPNFYYKDTFSPINERKITNEDMTAIIEQITDAGIDIIQFLTMLYYSFTNHKLYIQFLFTSTTIMKQYSKLNSHDLVPFEKLFKFILNSKYFNYNFNNIITLIELFMRFITQGVNNTNKIKGKINKHKYLRMINELDITYDEVSHLDTYFTALSSINLDFYFILRMNRFHINNKLMCLYIGQFHTNTIKHYLTEIVKTYDIIYYYLDNRHNATWSDTRVIIPDDIIIDLNEMILPNNTASKQQSNPSSIRSLKPKTKQSKTKQSKTKQSKTKKIRPKTAWTILVPLKKNRKTRKTI
jgi:hypothetical protein